MTTKGMRHFSRRSPRLGGRRRSVLVVNTLGWTFLVVVVATALYQHEWIMANVWAAHIVCLCGYALTLWTAMTFGVPALIVIRYYRTRELDQLVRRGLDDGNRDLLRLLVQARRLSWESIPRRRGSGMQLIHVDRIAGFMFYTGMAAPCMAWLMMYLHRASPLLLFFGLLCQLAALVAVPMRQKKLIATLHGSLRESRCPDCGYDLTTVIPAVPPAEGLNVGPQTCPECGTRWPLVPGNY